MGMVAKIPSGGTGSALPTTWSKVAEQKETITYTIPGPGYYRLNFNYTASGDYFTNAVANSVVIVPPADSRLDPCVHRNMQVPGRGSTFSLLLLVEVEGAAYRVTEVTTGFDFGTSTTIRGHVNTSGGVASFAVWRGIE